MIIKVKYPECLFLLKAVVPPEEKEEQEVEADVMHPVLPLNVSSCLE